MWGGGGGSVDRSIQWSVVQVRRGVHGPGVSVFRVTPEEMSPFQVVPFAISETFVLIIP